MQLHNTRTQSVEVFSPQTESTVSLYTCGPTVYSEPLIGNWVAYVRWDLLVRVLRANDFTVNRVMNITDVGHLTSDADEGEDKMVKGARREGITEWEVAERYTNRFLEGMTVLNLLPPEHLTKATEHIDIQIELIQKLEEKGFTYVIDDGVYFDTAKFPAYADFAHLDLEAQKAGARVVFNDAKRSSSDFVLWRLTPQGETRTMEWASPWGKGIPGWHIECSAMALKYLGETIDIHTGGIDHIPVHHTNEIAQSEAATGKPFANYWLHANFLLSEGAKISKSLGNGYTLSDLEEKGFTPLDFRMFVLQSHYRTESNFTWENMEAAANRLQHWKSIACLRHQVSGDVTTDASSQLLAATHAAQEALNSDLNSPLALTHYDSAFDVLEKTDMSLVNRTTLETALREIDEVLGLRLLDTTPDIDDEVKQRIVERTRARELSEWQRSDELRLMIAQAGIGLNDTPSGTRWYYL